MKRLVLHIIDSLDLGGAQVVVENLIKHGDHERFEFEVATLHGRGVFWKRFAALGVPVHSLSPRKWLPLYIPRLLWLLATRRYDVIHCHLIWSNIIAKPLAALCGVRTRINHDHCNDKATLSPLARTLDRWMNRLSTKIIAVSESTRADLIARGGVAPDRVVTIYNGIDADALRPRADLRTQARAQFGMPQDSFVVGGVGRLTFQKNFALFVDVAAEVLKAHPRAHFVIAGTGPEDEALQKQVADHGLGDRIRLLGFIQNTGSLYPALDCLLLTSRYEGLPITILEAMAAGVPIVASDLDGMREILSNETTALLAPPKEPAPFARAVRRLIEEPNLARSLADAARTLVETKLSAATATHAVEDTYAIRC